MKDCIFCKIIHGTLPATTVYEDADLLAFLDIKPVNPGHTLIVPKKHFENIHETPDTIIGNAMIVAKKLSDIIREHLGALGVNVSMNNGKAAGQVVFHTHIHVIPRYGKDNFPLWPGQEYNVGEREKIAEKIKNSL